MPRKAAAPPAPQRRPGTAAAQPPGAARRVTLSFPVPESVHTAVRLRAAEERTTVRAVVLRALKAAGFAVPDADLVDGRPGRAGRIRER